MNSQLQIEEKNALTSAPIRTDVLQRKCGCGNHTMAGGECEGCSKKHEGMLRRKAADSSEVDVVPPIVHEVLNSPGQRLDAATRAFFEPRFGHDFSDVRVHTDAKAAKSAQAVNALAYTVGQDVVFGRGQFTSGTSIGMRLLAHELTHVVQQSAVRPDVTALVLGSPNDRFEREAEQAGLNLAFTDASNRSLTSHITPALHSVVQRQLITPLAQGSGFGGLIEHDRQAVKGVTRSKTPLSVPEAIQGGWHQIDNLDEAALKKANLEQRLEMLAQLINAYWTGNAEEEAIIRIISTTPLSQASILVKQLTERKINGKSYLDELDRVVDFGNNLELHAVLSNLRLKAMGPEKGTIALETAPHLPWHDVMGIFDSAATFSVSNTTTGKILIDYPANQYYSKDFGEKIRKVGGSIYNPDQVLIIEDYDRARTVAFVARELVGYERAKIRTFLERTANVASLVTPLGAAKTALGKALIITEGLLNGAFLLIDENRLNLVKWFPKWGPKFIHFSNLVRIGMGVYGIGRFVISGWKIFKAWKEIRQARAAMEGTRVAPEAEKAALALEKQADDIFAEVEKIEASKTSSVEALTDLDDAAVASSTGKSVPEAAKLAIPLQVAESAGTETKGAAALKGAVKEAQEAGLMKGIKPGTVDLAVQPHSRAPLVREALGLKGSEFESAHVGATSALKDTPGYSRGQALTALLPKEVHTALDNQWKNWAQALRRQGRVQITAGELYKKMEEVIANTPGIEKRTKEALTWKIFDEIFKDLELMWTDNVRLPYSNIKPTL